MAERCTLGFISILLWINYVFASSSIYNNIKHIEVDDITKLTLKERSNLFEPSSYLSVTNKISQHNVNIFDKFGKFIRLNYYSEYEEHVDIFELKPNQENDIKSVQCINDETNTINVQFTNKYSAFKYFSQITTHSEKDPDKNKYFITGSHEWKCYNSKEKKYTPILRTISSVNIDPENNKILIIRTEYASYTDLFQNLEMSLKTNANIAESQYEDRDLTDVSIPESRRRLCSSNDQNRRSLLCDSELSTTSFWQDIINGVKQLWNAVTSIVSDLAEFVESAQDIYEDATELWDALTSGEYSNEVDGTLVSWTYNYDGSNSCTLELEDEVQCDDCYAYADLTYNIEISINDYELSYFKLTGSGEVGINVDIKASESYEDEWTAKTSQYSIPKLGFSIAGVYFGFSIYGEFAVGIDVEMAFSYTIYATASITRGVEYNADTGEQNYISEQSFDHGSDGPVLDFDSSSITVYSRATLYLVLSLVGDVYIGVQPKFEVELEEGENYGGTTGCAVEYTPSATITVFVGATLNLMQKDDVWSKEANIATFSLPAGDSGCITPSEILSLESWADEINSWFRRRRMLEDGDRTLFLVNYTSPSTAYQYDYKWGSKNNLWYGNLTALTSCNDTDNAPDFGELIVYPQDNDGNILYGIYKTINHISVDDGFIMTTDVECVGRYQFVKDDTVYNSSNDRIARYNVSIIDDDYKCDVNESEIATIVSKTQLPSEMDVIILDSSLGTIMMIDTNDCFMFPLSKNTKREKKIFTTSDFKQFMNGSYEWPSKTWFGSLHCDTENSNSSLNGISDSLTLYLNSMDWFNGKINATLLYHYDDDNLNNKYLTAFGGLDFEDLTLDFDLYDEFGEYKLSVHGFITCLTNGKLIYSGIIPSHNECTGFIFQGYLNMDQFDDNSAEVENVVIESSTDDTATINMSSVIAHIAIGFGIAVVLILMSICIVMKCSGYIIIKKSEVNKDTEYSLMQDENL